MKTEEEMDDILDRNQYQLYWVNNVLHDKTDDSQMSEGNAGRFFAALINEVCDFERRWPLTIIDLKPWIEE